MRFNGIYSCPNQHSQKFAESRWFNSNKRLDIHSNRGNPLLGWDWLLFLRLQGYLTGDSFHGPLIVIAIRVLCITIPCPHSRISLLLETFFWFSIFVLRFGGGRAARSPACINQSWHCATLLRKLGGSVSQRTGISFHYRAGFGTVSSLRTPVFTLPYDLG